MTAPEVPCVCGVPHLGYCPGTLTICVQQGFAFNGSIQLRTGVLNLPQDWPAGMLTRLRFSWGTGTEFIIAGTVDGSFLRFIMGPEDTLMIPKRSSVSLELNYTGGPFDWLVWQRGRLECGS